MPGSRFTLTVRERILLHLLDHSRHRDQVEVPISTTQQGISSAVGVARKHLPRSLRAMIDAGTLTERKAHVVGKGQRMKAYFLTDEGEAAARRLRRHVLSMEVEVEGPSPARVALGEFIDANKASFSLPQVLRAISPDGRLDPSGIGDGGEEASGSGLDRLEVYGSALAQAWKDGKLTTDEKEILARLMEILGITEREHLAIESEVLGRGARGQDRRALEVYRVALEQAEEDGVITDDERAILDRIKERFNLKGV